MNDLYLNMPVGDYYGWAICGKNLLFELSKMASLKYVEDKYEMAYRDEKTTKIVAEHKVTLSGNVDSPFIYSLANDTFTPGTPYRGTKNIGYVFYEYEKIPNADVETLNQMDVIVGGSTWNKEILEINGVKNATSIPQGVDRSIFFPAKRETDDKFVIFSCGKFEPRKAQDIIIDAVSIMQKKYHDIYLVACWDNIFDYNMFESGTRAAMMKLNPDRTSIHSLVLQDNLAKLMRETDVGLFPNRVEGGTNLALMEYLSCGRPVVANYSTGQADVLSSDYAFMMDGSNLLDDSVSLLEAAYKNRNRLSGMGEKADAAMEAFTWDKTAKKFLELCNG